MIPPKRFNISPPTGGCSEGLDAFRFFLKQHLLKVRQRRASSFHGSSSNGCSLFRYHHGLIFRRLSFLTPTIGYTYSGHVRYRSMGGCAERGYLREEGSREGSRKTPRACITSLQQRVYIPFVCFVTTSIMMPLWEDQSEQCRTTATAGPDCAVMCYFINTDTTHQRFPATTIISGRPLGGLVQVLCSLC